MRVRIEPGGLRGTDLQVPGDKSIAHRWLILAATGRGRSVIRGLPPSLDVRSTASCLAALAPSARPALERWLSESPATDEPGGFTWDAPGADAGEPELSVEGEGRNGLAAPDPNLECGNSGTTMRLLSGVVASRPFRTVLTGDASLLARPMERVAEPLRRMGARVLTAGGRPPIEIEGGPLDGVEHVLDVPSAQVKGALLLAGLDASGETSIREPVATRDHTERALAALGAPVLVGPGLVRVSRFQHEEFEGTVPGDPSSAAFLVAAAFLGRVPLTVRAVGLNPSRTYFLDVLARMGADLERRVEEERLGEPVGIIEARASGPPAPVRVEPGEIPLLIDEVPLLAVVAAFAQGESRFSGAGELRVKEADRLHGTVQGIRTLGGDASADGDDLLVGGGGLAGGRADALADHRLAMAFAVGALAARGRSEIEGMESAAVSFPGFARALSTMGATLEALG